MSMQTAWENAREGEYHDDIYARELADLSFASWKERLRLDLVAGRESWSEAWQHISAQAAERLEMWMREIYLGNQVDTDDLRAIAEETVELWLQARGKE